eukprot:scaffold2.g7339.t1
MSEEAPRAQEDAQEGGEAASAEEARKPKELRARKLAKLKAKAERRGIKPQKLRQMLEQYAELGRLYLAPEDPALRRKRKQAGGNTGKNFTEGWVEFEDKARAKEVVAMLNGQPMGGRKRSAYYYDLWCMKYLPKFKWDHLTEEINYQRAVREQRMAAEISAAKRERDFYLSQVDRAKAHAAMADRKRKRQEQQGDGGEAQQEQRGGDEPGSRPQRRQQEEAQGGGQQGQQGQKVLRVYGQRTPKADPVTDAAAPVVSDGLLRLIAGQGKRRRQQRREGEGG